VSRSVDLFIRCEQTLAELAESVRRITGLPFEADLSEGTFVTRADNFEAVLHEHGYGEDGLLSRYRYVLSAAVGDGVRLQEAPATVMLRLVADQLQRQGGWSVLLVLDLQYRDRASAGGPLAGSVEAGGSSAAAPLAGSVEAGGSSGRASSGGDAGSRSAPGAGGGGSSPGASEVPCGSLPPSTGDGAPSGGDESAAPEPASLAV
jgi:hypothetical protein